MQKLQDGDESELMQDNLAEQNIEEEPIKKNIDNLIESQENTIQNDQDIIENTLQTPITSIKQEEVLPDVVINLSSVVNICNSLCKSDKEAYCKKKREVIFGAESITYGTCRSLAKYNRNFQKCESFCKEFSENKGPSSYCTLADGRSDNNCDGK